MKKRKLEKWSEELFPGYSEEAVKAYDHLNDRELIIVAASVFDAAILELIELRLVDDFDEQDDLLGITKFEKPLSALTARARMAYLLGLLRKVEANSIRYIANIRNHMAHKSTATLKDPEVIKMVEKLVKESRIARITGEESITVRNLIAQIHKDVEVTRFIVKTILVDLQMNFDKRKTTVKRLGECKVRAFASGFEESP
jgi:DNA-binding MltR family transcriptional regulator